MPNTNQTWCERRAGILPTPAIAAVGIIDDVHQVARLSFPAPGLTLLLIGDTKGELGQSLYLREIHGKELGAPPPVDLAAEKRNGDFVRAAIADGAVAACHDVSDGGLLVAVAEMAMGGGIGARLSLPIEAGLLFGEDQARYIIATAEPKTLEARAAAAKVPLRRIGTTGGEVISLDGESAITVSALKAAHEAWLPAYMAGRD